MRVKNVNGTSELDCKCGSWLEHWKKFSGTTLPTYCYEKSCTKKPTLGAHVQKEAELNGSWYIAPLCADHNKQTKSMELIDGAVLVPANVSHTCGKSQNAFGTSSGYARWQSEAPSLQDIKYG